MKGRLSEIIHSERRLHEGTAIPGLRVVLALKRETEQRTPSSQTNIPNKQHSSILPAKLVAALTGISTKHPNTPILRVETTALTSR